MKSLHLICLSVHTCMLLECACTSKTPNADVLLGRPRIKMIAYLCGPNRKQILLREVERERGQCWKGQDCWMGHANLTQRWEGKGRSLGGFTEPSEGWGLKKTGGTSEIEARKERQFGKNWWRGGEKVYIEVSRCWKHDQSREMTDREKSSKDDPCQANGKIALLRLIICTFYSMFMLMYFIQALKNWK